MPRDGRVNNSTLTRRKELPRGRGPARSATPLPKVNTRQRSKRRAVYSAFIRSAAWKRIRLETFRLADYRCALCPFRDESETGLGLICDHTSYRRFGGDEIPGEDTRALCRRCNDAETTSKRANWMNRSASPR